MKKNRRLLTILIAAGIILIGAGVYYYVMTAKRTHAHDRLSIPDEKLLAVSRDEISSSDRPAVFAVLGSFSPVTNAHIRMPEIARDYLKLVRPDLHITGGFLSPVGDAYGKVGLAQAEHRVAMARLAVEDSNWLAVDPWESKQSTHQRAVVVLQHIKDAVNAYYGINNIRVMLVCGADLVATFNKPGFK